MKDYLNQNIHSHNSLFQPEKMVKKRVLWEWIFWFSTGLYKGVLDESVYNYLFSQNAPFLMFDKVLNTPLVRFKFEICSYSDSQTVNQRPWLTLGKL